MKLLVLVILFSSAVVFAGCQLPVGQQLDQNENLQVIDGQQLDLKIDDTWLTVEAVTSTERIAQGLSGRAEIGAEGMLFVFSEARPVTFWMKEMLFDLDMVWIAQGKVVGVTAAVPRPEWEVPLDQLEHYPSPVAVDMVLELPAGKAAELEIEVGSLVQLPG